jgi:hypothetical protein
VLRREKRAARTLPSLEEQQRRTDFVQAGAPPVVSGASRAALHSQLQDPPELAGLQTPEELENYLHRLRTKVCLLRLIPLAAQAIGMEDPEDMQRASDWVEAAGECARA